MTPAQLEIFMAANERIASARLVLAEAEAYKELVLKYLADVKVDIVESQATLVRLIEDNKA